MPVDLFRQVLDFTRRIEAGAWHMGVPPFVLLSGGECTEHPQIVTLVEEVLRHKMFPMLITNGMWLADPGLRAALLRPEWSRLYVQVTSDPRFYPKAAPPFDDPRIAYVPSLSRLLPLGRAARKKNLLSLGVPAMKAPSSFNFRSLTRAFGSIEKAVTFLRLRSTVHPQGGGQCTPNITEEGSVLAGESRFCFRIGSIDSSFEELTAATIAMRCNACGLVDQLTEAQKDAIGEGP